MTEAFLHYLFDQRKLGKHFVSTEGHALIVHEFGYLNPNAGPDFQEATIHFDNKVWAGHIEFHMKSSDWMKHNHQFDPAYKNVIAHFVWKHDKEIFIDDFKLPVVELTGLIEPGEFEKYNRIIQSKSWIPCANQIDLVPEKIVMNQIESAALSRLKKKANAILDELDSNSRNQQLVLFKLLAKVIGGQVNGLTMVRLIEKVKLDHLSKLDFQPFKLQAFMHGLSGLLMTNGSQDPYVLALQKEFSYQSKLFNLLPLQPEEWKLSSVRPAGTPSNRISQLAAILANCDVLNFDRILDNLEFDQFWNEHFHFSSKVKKRNPGLSPSMLNLIKMNVVIPFNYAISVLKRDDLLAEKQILELKKIPPERNSIIDKWNKIKVKPKSAFESQGLLEQKKHHCNEKKCLFCAVGKQLLIQ